MNHNNDNIDNVWGVIKDMFEQTGRFKHQIDSFNSFIEDGITEIIQNEADIIISKDDEDDIFIEPKSILEGKGVIEKRKKKITHTYTFNEPFIPYASIVKSRKQINIYPDEARLKNLHYTSPLYVDIKHVKEVDGVVTETNFHKRVMIAKIPIMVRSCRCNLSKLTKEEILSKNECDQDQGGYFIISGNEKVVIAQGRMAYNKVVVTEIKSDKTKATHEASVRSMSNETGHSVAINATIEEREIVVHIPYIKQGIKAGIIFRAMGYTKKSDFSKLIGLENKYIDYIYRDSCFIAQESGVVWDEEECNKCSFCNKQFKSGDIVYSKPVTINQPFICCDKVRCKNRKRQKIALEYIGRYSVHNISAEKKLEYAQQIIESELFPHLGVSISIEDNAIFLGYILKQLIKTKLGFRDIDSKDNYINKRVESTGILFKELFRTYYKKYINNLTTALYKRADILLQTDKIVGTITAGLKNCMATGTWGAPKSNYVKTGVSQVLSRLSYGAAISHMRRMALPVQKEGKNGDMKLIDQSQWGYICPQETPEGQTVGTVLNFSSITTISDKQPQSLIREIMEENDLIIDIEEADMDDIRDLTKVFLNGIIIGYTEDAEELVKDIRKDRRNKVIDYSIGVYYDEFDDEVNINSDEGRLLRPLFTVEDGKILANGSMSWNEMFEKGYVEYIDINESQFLNIAIFKSELTPEHHYCEIHPCLILGTSAATIPFPDHNQSPRNCYYASMCKQAMGVVVSTYQKRTDTCLHILDYPQKPLVDTEMSKILGFQDMPAGVNAIVAINTCAVNQEDSIVMNKSAIDRGLFVATTYKTISTEEKKIDTNNIKIIQLPPVNIRKKRYNYDLLDERGIVREGSKIMNRDIIIGKVYIQKNKTGEEIMKDMSVIIKSGDEGYVERVEVIKTPDNYRLVKIIIRKRRIPEIGDKFASRSAQKATIGAVVNQEDMPWTASGMYPDIIFNTHGLPSRMTISQLLEMVLGKSCCIKGEYGDATPFSTNSVDIGEKLCEELGNLGFESTGKEVMYSGVTGERIHAKIMFGPTYYQRLKHMVSDKIHARASGAVTMLTRTPMEGRSRDGGLRTGEMEVSAIAAHGCSRILKERLFDMSDSFQVDICNSCGHMSHGECCDNVNIRKINLPYGSKLLFMELMAMGIKLKMKST